MDASADYDHGWEFDGSGDSYTAGVMLEWQLWDGQLTRGRVHEARAHRDAAEEWSRKIELAIGLETEQARLNLSAAEERLQVARRAVIQADESARLTRSRFGQGLALSTQLIDAETALTAAQVRLAQAGADRHIAIAALRRALGLPMLESSESNLHPNHENP